MNRNRLTSALSVEQLRQYNSLTEENERRLFLESLDVIDLTAIPTPDSAAQKHQLPFSFLPDERGGEAQQALADTWEQLLTDYAAGKNQRRLRELVNQLLRQQQHQTDQLVDAVRATVAPLLAQQHEVAHALTALQGQVLKTADVEGVLDRQVMASLRDIPDRLSGAVEGFVKKLVPAVIRVENPSDRLLRMTRFLTISLALAGLGLGGLFFWGLTRQAKLSEQTPDWAKYQYLLQKAQADNDRNLLNDLDETERLYTSGTFSRTLKHLETINSARRQQKHYRQEESDHQQQLRRTP